MCNAWFFKSNLNLCSVRVFFVLICFKNLYNKTRINLLSYSSWFLWHPEYSGIDKRQAELTYILPLLFWISQQPQPITICLISLWDNCYTSKVWFTPFRLNKRVVARIKINFETYSLCKILTLLLPKLLRPWSCVKYRKTIILFYFKCCNAKVFLFKKVSSQW